LLSSLCLPLRRGRCLDYSLTNNLGVNEDQAAFWIDDADSDVSASAINERFQQACGASLLHLEGDCYDDSWSQFG